MAFKRCKLSALSVKCMHSSCTAGYILHVNHGLKIYIYINKKNYKITENPNVCLLISHRISWLTHKFQYVISLLPSMDMFSSGVDK